MAELFKLLQRRQAHGFVIVQRLRRCVAPRCKGACEGGQVQAAKATREPGPWTRCPSAWTG